MPGDPSSDALWELAEFFAREALLLRSFLEYLRTSADSPEQKWQRLEHWKREIGLQLGSPAVNDVAREIFQTTRDEPPSIREQKLRRALAAVYAEYFGSSGE